MKLKKSYKLSEIAQYLNAEFHGNGECEITGLAPLGQAKSGQLSFLHDSRYAKFLANTQASAVILEPKYREQAPANYILATNPQLSYAKIATWFEYKPNITPGIHSSAVIGKECIIHPSAYVGPQCVLGDHVEIGENVVLHAGSTVGDYSKIGTYSTLYSGVSIYHHVQIGSRAVIHSGVVIGSDGFGMVNDKGTWIKVPQIGGVRIGDDVEIGANTTIDRGAIGDTIIENGVKLDNLIQIAHNVHIGAHTVVAACTAIAGSTRIGKYCMIAGAVAINGHIEIADQVILTATTTVSSSITQAGVYSSGIPAQPNQMWRKNAVRFQQLDDIARRLSKLEKQTS